MNDLSINSIFYRELLECWLQFRNLFLANKERFCIIWNNKDIRIDGKPVFYKSYYDSWICIINLVQSRQYKIIESFNAINNIVEKLIFLHAQVSGRQFLLSKNNRVHYLYRKYLFYKEEWDFWHRGKENEKLLLIISNKAQLPSNAKNLKHDFGLSDEDLKIAWATFILSDGERYD